MQGLVSIIIPAYNAEKTLGRCIESIQKSHYTNFEIIIVNDGSKDNTLQIAERYANGDARIRVINKENGGVSAARNAGLDMAKGEYVLFIDADDYVSAQFIEKLMKPCLLGADVSCCQLKIVDENGKAIPSGWKKFTEEFEVTPKQIADNYFTYLDMGIINFIVRLFRRSIIGETRFSETLKWGEDASFNLELFTKMNKMHVLPDEEYFYVASATQTTARRMKGYGDMMVQHIADIDAFIRRYDGYKNVSVCCGMGRVWLGVFVEAVRHSESCTEYKKTFYELKKQPWYYYIENPGELDFKWWMMHRLVQNGCYRMLYVINKGYAVLIKIKKRIKK